jgi:hypothetical protein
MGAGASVFQGGQMVLDVANEVRNAWMCREAMYAYWRRMDDDPDDDEILLCEAVLHDDDPELMFV